MATSATARTTAIPAELSWLLLFMAGRNDTDGVGFMVAAGLAEGLRLVVRRAIGVGGVVVFGQQRERPE